MTEKSPEWLEFREKVITKLVERLKALGVDSAEKYIDASFWMFSCILQDLQEKVTTNKEYYSRFYPMLYQLQDVLRANHGCQQNIVVCSAAFNLRVTFEIYCNMRYIFRNPDPKKMTFMFDRYQEVEKFLHKEQFTETKVSEEEREKLDRDFPEWFMEKGKRRKCPLHHWTAIDRMNTKQLAKEVGLENEYYVFYGATSKFTHASQLTWNFFRTNGVITPIPDPKTTTMFTIASTAFAMKCLFEFCHHFGVTLPTEEYVAIHEHFLEAQKFVDSK